MWGETEGRRVRRGQKSNFKNLILTLYGHGFSCRPVCEMPDGVSDPVGDEYTRRRPEHGHRKGQLVRFDDFTRRR